MFRRQLGRTPNDAPTKRTSSLSIRKLPDHPWSGGAIMPPSGLVAGSTSLLHGRESRVHVPVHPSHASFPCVRVSQDVSTDPQRLLHPVTRLYDQPFRCQKAFLTPSLSESSSMCTAKARPTPRVCMGVRKTCLLLHPCGGGCLPTENMFSDPHAWFSRHVPCNTPW